MDDGPLVKRAKQGDVYAYEELVRRYQALAFRAAYLFCGNRADAEDAVQEAFVKAYQSLASFRDNAAFKPWLLRIVTNEAHNRHRSAGRQARLSLREAAHRQSFRSVSPESSVLEAELRSEMIAYINLMSTIDREVITCRYFLDLTVAETADVLQCPESTVRTRLFRAINRLRDRLAAEEESTHPDTWKRPVNE